MSSTKPISQTSRKKKGDRTKQYRTPTDPSPLISISTKQKEVLQLLNEGMIYSQIARKLSIYKSTLKSRMDGLIKKGLVNHTYGSYRLTQAGKMAADSVSMGSTGSQAIKVLKSVHSNEFSVTIKDFPRQWHSGHFYFQDHLKRDEKSRFMDFFHNQSANQWLVYYDDCTIRISPKTKKITFWIQEQLGHSFDELASKVFDRFVFYYRLIERNGFSLDYEIESKDPDFANPKGFFAKLASHTTNKGFRIDVDYDNKQSSFWVDFSPPDCVAEEETDDTEVAQRMERLADSAVHSKSDFRDLDNAVVDLDKLKDIVANLVRIQATQMTGDISASKNISDKFHTRGDYIG